MRERSAPPDKSVLLDYVSLNPISSLLAAWNNKHWAVVATNLGSCLLIFIVGLLSKLRLNLLNPRTDNLLHGSSRSQPHVCNQP